jgi:hypothetical protein
MCKNLPCWTNTTDRPPGQPGAQQENQDAEGQKEARQSHRCREGQRKCGSERLRERQEQGQRERQRQTQGREAEDGYWQGPWQRQGWCERQLARVKSFRQQCRTRRRLAVPALAVAAASLLKDCSVQNLAWLARGDEMYTNIYCLETFGSLAVHSGVHPGAGFVAYNQAPGKDKIIIPNCQ